MNTIIRGSAILLSSVWLLFQPQYTAKSQTPMSDTTATVERSTLLLKAQQMVNKGEEDNAKLMSIISSKDKHREVKPKRRTHRRKRSTANNSETVYFRKGDNVYESKVKKQGGLIIVDLDSLKFTKEKAVDTIYIQTTIVEKQHSSKFKKFLNKIFHAKKNK